jgi:CheY-like chemotaxis protein
MDSKVLLVDDDGALLRSLERNLCFDYALTTADSGQAALDLLADGGPFSVIVTDMRMPGMDGVAFIEAARVRTPRSIFLMLTGNQDVETAIKAVNDGHVFRFLNKPCEIAEIKRAIDAALRQFELVQAEKELLQKTFVGAVNMLTDVIDALRPEVLQQSDQIDAVMRSCEEGLGFCGPWEFRLAARLGLLGLALQPDEEQSRFRLLSPADPESDRLFKKIATTSAKLIERIPRLDRVADIIRMQCGSDSAMTAEAIQTASTAAGGLLLRVATQWTFMMNAGTNPETALLELRESLPDLPPRLCCALLSTEMGKANAPGRSVALENLREGMILYDNVLSDDGALLLRKGRRLTLPVIEKLRSHGATSEGIREIVVVDNSAKLAEVS